MRLDLRGANLQCDFPAADFSTFQWLTTLNLGRNPNLQVSHAPSDSHAASVELQWEEREGCAEKVEEGMNGVND
jgi:hypothetical protein